MKEIFVNTSNEYSVLIGNDLLSQAAAQILRISKPCKVAIISDTNVWPLYGKVLQEGLNAANFETIHYCFQAGEASKNTQTYIDIVNFLAQNEITRTDLLIALGGGVVGDICGFAAATFLRGISYVQIPTSLLAMVDSSIGGKTAIDLPAGKNLLGAFYQPRLVLCDTNLLSTLPEHVFIDGCAEIIKYGILYDAQLFAHLLENGLKFDREYVISTCVKHKKDVVTQDEFDRGERQKLNLGHTIGHAIERLSDYTISHGNAVAIGTVIVTKAACSMKLCDGAVLQQIKTIMKAFHLSVKAQYSAEALTASALSDKKRTSNTINLIVPERIGSCKILTASIDQLQSIIEAGLS